MSAQTRSLAGAPDARPRPRPTSTAEIADAVAGMAWWNRLTEPQRKMWTLIAGSAVPAEAWEEFKAREVSNA
jgi:hypothetical protein